MLDWLPALPDLATLEAMQAWAAVGGALGFGAIAVQWLSKRILGRAPLAAVLHIPGAPRDSDPAPPPWSVHGLLAAALGGVVGALGAWGLYGPDEAQRRIGAIFAVLGVIASVWQLLRVQRDGPAVGEAPPDDPEQTLAARLRKAWGGLAFAAFGLLIALI